MTRWLVLGVLLGASACSTGGLLGQGGHCSAAEQCGPGLLCDTSQKPAVCSTMVKNQNDLAAPGDLAGLDLAGTPQDQSATPDDIMAAPDLAKAD